MAVSWTHTIEERLSRLERRQERLMSKLAALTDALKERNSARDPDGGRPAHLTVSPPQPAQPAAETGDGPGAAGAGLEVTGGGPPVAGNRPAAAGEHPEAREYPEAREQPEAGDRSGAGRPPAAGGRPGAARGMLTAPIGGGGGTLAMWRPSRGLAPRERRHRILARVDELTEAVNTLSAAMQRLQIMCDLLGQCVYLAVDPRAAAHRVRSLGPRSASTAEDGEGGDGQGTDAASGLAGALAGLLPGLVGQGSGEGEGEAGPEGGGDTGAGPGETGAGGNDPGAAPSGQSAALNALLPLLQSLTARNGRDHVAARLGTLVGSPAFQQLLGMVQSQQGLH